MLVEKADLRRKLLRIVAHLVADSFWRQELYQEATLHLWQAEREFPGQTNSWYLQRCRFHLQHLLRGGQSVDAPNRMRGRVHPVGNEDELWSALLNPDEVDDVVVSEVSAREMLSLISEDLTGFEKNLLNGLTEGLSSRELAVQLGVSQTCIVKHRRRIAELARRRGLGKTLPA